MDAKEKWKLNVSWHGKSHFVPAQWSDDEFKQLLDAGRMIERQAPGCPGVSEYQDTQDKSYTATVAKVKSRSGFHKSMMGAETDDHHVFMKDWESVKGMNSSALGSLPWASGRLAIEDKQHEQEEEQEDEETQLEQFKSKVRKQAKTIHTRQNKLIESVQAKMFKNAKKPKVMKILKDHEKSLKKSNATLSKQIKDDTISPDEVGGFAEECKGLKKYLDEELPA